MSSWTAGLSLAATQARPQIECYLFAVRLENGDGAILSPLALAWREKRIGLNNRCQLDHYWTARDRIWRLAIRDGRTAGVSCRDPPTGFLEPTGRLSPKRN